MDRPAAATITDAMAKEKMAKVPNAIPMPEPRSERGLFIFTGEDGSHGVQLRGITVLEAYAAVTLVYNKLAKQFNGDA